MNDTIIFVDICNTIANVNNQLVKRGFHTDIYPCEVPVHVWEDTLTFKEAEPIKPVIYFVTKLAAIGKIFYLTARSQKFHDVTSDWLRRHGLPEGPIIFTNGKPKGEYVFKMSRQFKAAIVLEDSPYEIQSIQSLNPHVHLFIPDWSYNRHIQGNRIRFS